MQQHRLNTTKCRRPFWTAVLCAFFAMAGEQSVLAQTDTVEELRATLSQLDVVLQVTPAILEHREQALRKHIDALNSIGQLRRALALNIWRENPSGNEIQRLDARMRELVAERLTNAIAETVKEGDKYSKHALANSIAEMGPKIRAIQKAGEMNHFGFARSLTPLVIQLANDPDLGVRQEGLRALGTINPDPDKAVSVFQKTIESDARLGPRRVAAHGLMQMVLVASFLQSGAKKYRGVSLTGDEALDIFMLATDAVDVALQTESDLEVKILGLQAIQEAAAGAESMIENPFKRNLFPPAGRPLTPAERDVVVIRYNKVKSEIDFTNRLLDKFKVRKNDIAPVMRVTSSQDSAKAAYARLMAVRAFERIANLRVRLKNRADSVVVTGDLKDKLTPLADEIVDPFGDLVADDLASFDSLLQSSDVRVRRSVMDFFGLIGKEAAPAVSLINRHLDRKYEPDRFVRWSAAEAVANLPLKFAAATVPNMVKLLLDLDVGVRQSATQTIATWGGKLNEADATAVVQGLAKAAVQGDVEPRLASMQALNAYPDRYSANALPSLLENLKHPDARVRRAATAVIGNYGPSAKVAIPDLRNALGDSDEQVRINASDAILAILRPLE